MKIPQLFFLSANVVEHDEYTISVQGFRGLAFQSPLSGQWCSLRSGVTLTPLAGDEVVIIKKTPLRETWSRLLAWRFPNWHKAA